jgi:hypothetical protein
VTEFGTTDLSGTIIFTKMESENIPKQLTDYKHGGTNKI